MPSIITWKAGQYKHVESQYPSEHFHGAKIHFARKMTPHQRSKAAFNRDILPIRQFLAQQLGIDRHDLGTYKLINTASTAGYSMTICTY